jgi:DNA-binding Xre family transcriptional regulator
MARGPLKTAPELRKELAQMKAKYDELADEVRAAVDALERNEQPKAVARRLRTHVRFGAPGWEQDAIVEAAWEWAHRYGTSPTSTDWNPAMLRKKGGDPEALERYLDGNWPSTATVLRKFDGSWRKMLDAAGLPHNDEKVGQQRTRRSSDDLAALPIWTGWELVGGFRERARIASHADLARRAGLSWATVRNIEQGNAPNPTLRVFLAIAVGLNVQPAALLEYRVPDES